MERPEKIEADASSSAKKDKKTDAEKNTTETLNSLYVDNWPSFLDESQATKLLKPYNLVKMQVICGKELKKSNLLAILIFGSKEDAKAAMKFLNQKGLNGHRLFVSLRRNPKKPSDRQDIVIKNLPKNFTEAQVEKLCSDFGPIFSIHLPNKEKPGPCFVYFEKEGAAKAAIKQLNEKQIDGNKIIVEKFMTQIDRANLKTDIFVGNFPENFDEAAVEIFLNEICPLVGKIEKISVNKGFDRYKKKTRFCGIVRFEKAKYAKKAIEMLNEADLKVVNMGFYDFSQKNKDGLSATYAYPQHLNQRIQSKRSNHNIYVKNLLPDVTEDELRKIFEKYGEIEGIVIKNHKRDDPSKLLKLKFAFINFKSLHGAKKNHLMTLAALNDPDFLRLVLPKNSHRDYLQMQNRREKKVRQQLDEIKLPNN